MKIFDISKYQKGIDLYKAASYGYDGVIIRIAHNKKLDSCFRVFTNDAYAAGLWVGFYVYNATKNFNDSFEVGKFAAEQLESIVPHNIDIVAVYSDQEERLQSTKEINWDVLTGFRAGLESVNKKYVCGVYSGEYRFKHYFPLSDIVEQKFPIWVAKYNTEMPDIGVQYHIWQYTSGYDKKDFYTKNLDRSLVLNPNVDIEAYQPNYDNLTVSGEVILDVIRDRYGSGELRKRLLKQNGFNPARVQSEVNKYYAVAIDIINGDYGIGEKRKEKLRKRGYDAYLSQQVVNVIYNNYRKVK